MFTCKQVSKTLAENDYEKLPPLKKFLLKVHIALCAVCGKFNRQVMESQDMCRHYKEKESSLECCRPTMDEDKKKQLKILLAGTKETPEE